MIYTEDQIATRYRVELDAFFTAENAAHRLEEAAEIAALHVTNPEILPGITVQDSFFYEVYRACEIEIHRNQVQVLLPEGFGIGPEFIALFNKSEMTWTLPIIGAILVKGEPRVIVELLLVDYYDDEAP